MEDAPMVLNVANFLLVLFLTGVAAFYTWRAYTLQRVATSPDGLDFLLGSVEQVDLPKPSVLEKDVHRPAGTLVGVYARGPGVRYNVTPIVWSKASTMVISESRTTWAAEDGPLEAELWFLNPREKTHDTYFGLVWESPSVWTRKFVVRGYRVKLKWDGGSVKYDSFEVWGDRAKKWLYMPNAKEQKLDESSPAYGSSKVGWDLRTQMEHRALDRRFDNSGSLDRSAGA